MIASPYVHGVHRRTYRARLIDQDFADAAALMATPPSTTTVVTHPTPADQPGQLSRPG